MNLSSILSSSPDSSTAQTTGVLAPVSLGHSNVAAPDFHGDDGGRQRGLAVPLSLEEDPELQRPPYPDVRFETLAHDVRKADEQQVILAGGIGGTTGDILMHSLDTVKTRQQGDPHWPPRYTTLAETYSKIFRQEGLRRGLYGGFTAAMLGSLPGTCVFFGAYEWCKRSMIDRGISPSVAYLTSGFLADLTASVIYVPSEVLKTRLQLQGRYNNPFFNSGYNYRSTWDAAKTIARAEGFGALYSGYRATIWRDLPFSAIQFAIYEQEHTFAVNATGSRDIGLWLEMITGASAGGIAGVLTCPLDVVKTRTQTQISPDTQTQTGNRTYLKPSSQKSKPATSCQRRHLHSSPRTVPRSITTIDTSSVLQGLKIIYTSEGIAGWFRGVGPRFVWTSVQSCTMLVMYQYLLKHFEAFRSGQSERSRVV